MRKFIIPVFLALLLCLTVLVGCTKIEKVYVCADGMEYPEKAACGVNKVAGVKKMEAEKYANNYVQAYFIPYGGKARLVSSYLDPKEGDYKATFIVSDKDGSPYETKLLIDGLTGEVSCKDKCDYTKPN
jgi:hypothetical protein